MSEVSSNSQSEHAYDTYKNDSIKLLNKLMNCPKEPAIDSGSKGTGDIGGVTSGKKTTETNPEPNKSSTPLQHNGNVGDLEELIFFLLKSPATLSIQTKLNEVYKIFNPNARDLLSKPTPKPVPVADSESRDKIISDFEIEYTNTREKLNNSSLIEKPFFVEGGSPKNILGSFETACLKTINDLKHTNLDHLLFSEYPALLKAKKDTLDKISSNTLFTDTEKTICLEYIDMWKTEMNKIIESTKPNI